MVAGGDPVSLRRYLSGGSENQISSVGEKKILIEKGTFNNFHHLIWPEAVDDQLFACILWISEWFAERHFCAVTLPCIGVHRGEGLGSWTPLTPLSIAPLLAVPKHTGSKWNRRKNTLDRLQPPAPWRSYRAHLIWMILFSYFRQNIAPILNQIQHRVKL